MAGVYDIGPTVSANAVDRPKWFGLLGAWRDRLAITNQAGDLHNDLSVSQISHSRLSEQDFQRLFCYLTLAVQVHVPYWQVNV